MKHTTMKKMIAFALATIMLVALCACGGGNSSESGAGASAEAFKLGGTGPLTGGAAIYGNAAKNGAQIVIATIGTIATCTWIAGGLLIQKFYLKHYRIINIVLALTLLECVYSILR